MGQIWVYMVRILYLWLKISIKVIVSGGSKNENISISGTFVQDTVSPKEDTKISK